MSLLGVIAEYDRKQQAYIDHLEAENEKLREQLARVTDLMMSATMANERKTLQLILGGHYDKIVNGKEAPSEEATPVG